MTVEALAVEEVERRSIDYVPASERHGRPRDLFTLWFASNANIVGAFTGALPVFIGLDLKWAIVAILLGNLAGGIFMAYHSVQGPRLGIPQMIQSRAQFGFVGAILPMIITVIMYLGFQTEGGITLGAALAVKTGLPTWLSIVIINAVGAITALVGYRLIHQVSRVTAVISGVIMASFLIDLLTQVGSVGGSSSNVTWQMLLLGISFSVSWQITWAPYVSDYSRYLPEGTSSQTTFWYTYLGSVASASLVMILGACAAVVAADAFSADSLGYLTGLFSSVGLFLFWVLFVIGCGIGGASGPYGAFLTAYATISGKGADPDTTPKVRAAFVVGFLVVATVLAIVMSADMAKSYENITLFLLYLLVPWTAINLMDYYVIRHGNYDIPQLFERNGIYGLLNWRAIGIYVVAVIIEIPFVNSSLYVGPISTALDGADIAWIVGVVFSAVAYYLLVKPSVREPGRLVKPGV